VDSRDEAVKLIEGYRLLVWDKAPRYGAVTL
jgi:hypothetical protein